MVRKRMGIFDMRNPLLKRVLEKLDRESARFVFKKPAFFPTDRRVVSFSFDDFPYTAIENGARILEENDARGTFYISLGLAGLDSPVGPIATYQDVIALAQRGHEIGGHTFGHLNCARISSKAIHDDCLRNKQVASEIGGILLQSFAYPFGGIDPASKRVVGKLYGSARLTTPRINRGSIDLAALGSVELYRNTGKETIFHRLDEIDRSGGWLIFHSHDVSEEPSKFGCSIEFFEVVVKACSSRGFQIMPVIEAAMVAS